MTATQISSDNMPGTAVLPATVTNEQANQMNTYRQYVALLVDPGTKDENKLKAAQEISEDLEASDFLLFDCVIDVLLCSCNETISQIKVMGVSTKLEYKNLISNFADDSFITTIFFIS